MKRNFKLILTILMSVVLALASCPVFAAGSADGTPTAAYETNADESISLYRCLVDTIDKDSYGGMYLDDQGILNILTVDLSVVEPMISEKLNVNQKVIFKPAKYSYAELMKTHTYLTENMQALNIYCVGLDEINNCVRVGVYNKDTNFKQSIQNLINKDYVIIEDVTSPIEDYATTIKNGAAISSDTGSFTATCGVTWVDGITHYGFLSCAHGAQTVGSPIYYGGVKCGSVYKRVYSGSVDAMLIERASTSYLSSYLFTDGSSYSSPAATYVKGGFPVGTLVSMFGSVSGKKAGSILDTNFAYTDNGVNWTGLVKASFISQHGDSGGPIKVVTGTIPNTHTYVAGINKAGTSTYSVYVDMTKAKNSLVFNGYSN